MSDERIRAAAIELGAALTEGGKDYWVTASAIEVTRIQSVDREFVWNIEVEETARRRITA